MAFTVISDASLSVDKFMTSPTVMALRDNPGAISEAASGAPVIQQAWHPYDKVTNGDANIGRIYNSAVDGALANLVTADFADGYEYQLRIARVFCSAVVSSTMRMEFYGETSAAYSPTTISIQTIAAGDAVTGMIDFPLVRSVLWSHPYDMHGGVAMSSGLLTFTGSAQKTLKIRLSFSTGNINGGKIYLYRRKAFELT
jgi:hypothetical protein